MSSSEDPRAVIASPFVRALDHLYWKLPGAWLASLTLFLLLLGLYSVNGREIGIGDTIPAMEIAVAAARGDGPFLDRFYPDRDNLPYWVKERRGHVVSCYPMAPGLLAAPLTWVQLQYWDWASPGWESDPVVQFDVCRRMAKVSASVIAALTGVVLFQVLRLLGAGRWSWVAALAASAGSTMWAVASQALWQHGPAALAFSVALLFLAPSRVASWRLVLAGLATAAMVCFRSIDVVFAAAIFIGVAWRFRWRTLWFLPFPILLGGLLVGSNWWFFGTLEGGQAELEKLHAEYHNLPHGTWSPDVLGGLAGTLVSPNRGLLVFTPWIVVVLLALPWFASRLRDNLVVLAVAVALVPYAILLGAYGCWWAGASFGPRFWTDSVPVWTPLLGFGLQWAWAKCRPLLPYFAIGVGLAVGVQVIGAYYYPSTWNMAPESVDTHHERLWDWRDTELSRCLEEGPPPP